MSHILSPFQVAIFEEIKSGSSNLFVNAGPGSAKTYTATESIKYIPPKRVTGFFCYNKHIADELQRRVPGSVTASTIHAHGRKALVEYRKGQGKYLPGSADKYKYVNIAEQALTGVQVEEKKKQRLKFELKDLIILALNTRTEYGQNASAEEIEDMAIKYNITITEPILYTLVGPCVQAGIELFIKTGMHDFIDMTTLPMLMDLPVNRYDEVLIDEGQDLNDAQLTIMLKSVYKGGRIIEVADPFQSIMGFTGAMPDAVDQYVERTSAKSMPLSVCYRCPPNHVAIARHVCPGLVAFKTEDGILEAITMPDSLNMLKDGDYVLCRLTAPLIKQCLALISKGISAIIKGKDIGTDLIKFAESAQAHRDDFDTAWTGFPNACRKEMERILDKLSKEKRENQMDSMEDKVDALICLYDFFHNSVTDIKSLCAKINGLFDDYKNTPITLCTVHKSKGLEADNIFILDGNEKRDFWPIIRKGQASWQLQQERNIIYVGVTRAKKALYFITAPSKFEERMSYFVDGKYASLGKYTIDPPKVNRQPITVPKPETPIIINTDIIESKRLDRIDRWKKKHGKPVKPRVKPVASKMDDDDMPLFKSIKQTQSRFED